MKLSKLVFLMLFTGSCVAGAAEHDFLAQQTLPIRHASPEQVLDKTADNLKAIFQRYRPQLDSSTTVISPLQIGGTQNRPVVKITVRKCVAVFCETVDLDAEVSLHEVRGTCKRNLLMQADLRRSSRTLSDVYDRLDVVICFRNLRAGEGSLEMTAHAHRAPTYASGIVQRQIVDFLKLQIEPISRAVAETLKSHGARGL